jgi:two-component system sensor histidine kinase UhpB
MIFALRLETCLFWGLSQVLKNLWYQRTVRTQILLAVGVINVFAVLLAGAVLIMNTRAATKVEMEAALEVAQRFVSATMKELAAQQKPTQFNQELSLQLKHLRHVRILLKEPTGQLSLLSPQSEKGVFGTVPGWFATLMRPQFADRAVRVVALEHVNPVIILGEPADEIAEAWDDLLWLTPVWLALNALILAVLYIVLGRVLEPLGQLSKGMLRLEDGHYGTRLSPPKVKELSVLAERFNTLANALGAARDENSRLYRQLITVQEEERRAIANELHDEAGACLFGITANASSIQNLAEQRRDGRRAEINRRAGEILSIVERLKLLNRALLKKLKPGALGPVKLTELLDDLIAGFQRRHPGTDISVAFRKLDDSYGELINLALYRCIQEGITNAIRHGGADKLSVELAEIPAQRRSGGRSPRAKLSLCLSDNGGGITPATPKGFGLTAMAERVKSLGGSCMIETAPSKGTILHIEIPVERASTIKQREAELVGRVS